MLKMMVLLVVNFWIVVAQAATLQDLAETHFEKSEQGISISVYELKHQTHFFASSPTPLSVIADFQKLVQERTPTDPYFLLRRQLDVFLKYGMPELQAKFQQALSQPLPAISYLEEMLFELHQEKLKRPLFGSYSEFGAHILRDSNDTLVVIFVSNPKDAMVPTIRTTTELLESYLAKGFQYYTFVHNHPFNFDNPEDHGGTTIPSGNLNYGDVSAFIMYRNKYGLQNAWITNGFNTIRIPAADFEKY
ncbi:hypothetical protein [Bdellovibrio sp. HCB2-146]|uniref:hypothetical protein n=1 Tax=Bdellovibrio sp. HCB2-146 TaxID=3394362 RepID=UPI0039BD73B4